MTPEMSMIVLAVIVIAVLSRPDVILQLLGAALLMASPVMMGMPGAPAVEVGIGGALMMGVGRICYHAGKFHHLMRAVHPEAARKVRVAHLLPQDREVD